MNLWTSLYPVNDWADKIAGDKPAAYAVPMPISKIHSNDVQKQNHGPLLPSNAKRMKQLKVRMIAKLPMKSKAALKQHPDLKESTYVDFKEERPSHLIEDRSSPKRRMTLSAHSMISSPTLSPFTGNARCLEKVRRGPAITSIQEIALTPSNNVGT